MMLQSTPVVRAHRGAFDQLVYPVLCLGDRHETSLENIQVYFSQLTRVYQEALEEGLQQGLEPIRAQVLGELGAPLGD